MAVVGHAYAALRNAAKPSARPRIQRIILSPQLEPSHLMSIRSQFYIITIVFTAVFTPLGMSILDEKHQISSNKLEKYREAQGTITSATKVSKRRAGSSVQVDYKFSAENGRSYSGSAAMTTDDWKSVETSQIVRVLYDPSMPHQNSLARAIEDYADERPLALRASVGAVFGMPFGLAVAGVWVWFAKRRKHGVTGQPG